MAEETFLCVKMAVYRYVTFQPFRRKFRNKYSTLSPQSAGYMSYNYSPHQVSCLALALVSRIIQGSFITGRHQLDKRAIKTSGLFLYRSAPCRSTPSGSHKPLSSRSKSAKVSTRPRSALECRDKRGQVLSCQRHRPSWSSLTHPPSWLIQSQDKFDTTNPWSFLPPSVTYPAHPPVHFLSLPLLSSLHHLSTRYPFDKQAPD